MSQTVHRKNEYLEYREQDNSCSTGRKWAAVLLKCPACDYEFNKGCSRRDHLLWDHAPEDFGLSPLTETV